MIPAADVLALASALRNAVTDADAFGLIVAAIDDGLSWRDAAACWRDWQELQAATVIRLEAS